VIFRPVDLFRDTGITMPMTTVCCHIWLQNVAAKVLANYHH